MSTNDSEAEWGVLRRDLNKTGALLVLGGLASVLLGKFGLVADAPERRLVEPLSDNPVEAVRQLGRRVLARGARRTPNEPNVYTLSFGGGNAPSIRVRAAQLDADANLDLNTPCSVTLRVPRRDGAQTYLSCFTGGTPEETQFSWEHVSPDPNLNARLTTLGDSVQAYYPGLSGIGYESPSRAEALRLAIGLQVVTVLETGDVTAVTAPVQTVY